ncbi:MAG: hypothetical protein R3C11_07480 [Planctomycetaceae bacterium]
MNRQLDYVNQCPHHENQALQPGGSVCRSRGSLSSFATFHSRTVIRDWSRTENHRDGGYRRWIAQWGRGSVVGTLTGSVIIFLIGNGCTKIGLSNPVQDIALGVIIIAAVTIDQWRQRRIERS